MLQGSSLLKFQAERQINTPDIRVKMREGSYAYLDSGCSFMPTGVTNHPGNTNTWYFEEFGDAIIWNNEIYANHILMTPGGGARLFIENNTIFRYPINGGSILSDISIGGMGSTESNISTIDINTNASIKSFADWGSTLLVFQSGANQGAIGGGVTQQNFLIEVKSTNNGLSWSNPEIVHGISYKLVRGGKGAISGSDFVNYIPRCITALGPTTVTWLASSAFDPLTTPFGACLIGQSIVYIPERGISNNDGNYFNAQIMVSRKVNNAWGTTILVRDFYYLENNSNTNYRQSSLELKKLLAGVNRNGKDIIYYSFFEETINRNKLRISTFDSDNQEFERKEYILPTDFYINQMYAKNGLSHVYLYMRAGYQRFETGGKGVTLNQFSYPPAMVLKSSDGINFGFESYFNKITNPTGVYGVTVLLTAAQLLYPYTSNFLVGVTTNQAFEYVLLGISNRVIVTRNLNETNLSEYISTYSNTNNEQVNIKLGNYNA